MRGTVFRQTCRPDGPGNPLTINFRPILCHSRWEGEEKRGHEVEPDRRLRNWGGRM